MNTTTHRTRRGDGYATPGAVKEQGDSLPIYICNRCEREVVWATSKRTGRKYLVTVSEGRLGQRFYVGAAVHTDDVCVGRSDSMIAVLREQVADLEAAITDARALLVTATGDFQSLIERTIAEQETRRSELLAKIDRLTTN